MFEDHEKVVDGHAYDGDRSNYFPTAKQMMSYNFGPVEVDPSKKTDVLMWEELLFGLDSLIIQDSPIFPI